VLVFAGAFVIPWLLLTLFRLLYFNDVFPNTFYAKRGEGSKIFSYLFSRLPLFSAGVLVLAVGCITITAMAFGLYKLGNKMSKWAFAVTLRRYIIFLIFGTSILVYEALRGDWMPEYRYATPAFLFGPAAILGMLWDLINRAGLKRALPIALSLAFAAVVGVYGFLHTSKFIRSPAIPFSSVRETTLRIARTIEPLGSRPAVVTPDIGGALWENRFHVIDLAGLIDRTIGRSIRRDRLRLRDHLLNERKAEGIWLHGFWMRMTGFATDPVFARMYAPVWLEQPSPESPPTAGFFLRRELVNIGPDGLAYPPLTRKSGMF
jgi:hypothetical protein